MSTQPSLKCLYRWCLNHLVWKTVLWISHSEEKLLLPAMKSGLFLEDHILVASSGIVFSGNEQTCEIHIIVSSNNIICLYHI